MKKITACRIPAGERSVGLKWHHDNPEAARANVLKFDAKNPGRRAQISKECAARNPGLKKAWKRRNPEKTQRSNKCSRLRATYGITLVEYEALLAEQGGVCAACGNPPGKKALAVDHNHETAKIRALLCGPCNVALGWMKESPARLRKLAAYIEKHDAADCIVHRGEN